LNRHGTERIKRMVGLAIFTAIIIVLQLVCTFVKFGPFAITLALVPIIVGAAVYGPKAGAYLGAAFGAVVLFCCVFGMDPGGQILWNASPFLTVLLCFFKGAAAGFAAGVVYKALRKKSVYGGVFAAALVCPIVNTGIFIAAMFLFFNDILTSWAAGTAVLSYAFMGLAGVNFLVELCVNLALSPVILRILKAVSLDKIA